MSAFGVKKSEGDMCNGNLALTVTEGAVRKYIKVTKHVMETYGVDQYTRQNVEWLADSVESLFNNDNAKQLSLATSCDQFGLTGSCQIPDVSAVVGIVS